MKLVLFAIFLFWNSYSNAFFDGILAEAPCGCSPLKARGDIAGLASSELKTYQGFKSCLQCENLRDFSQLIPYLRTFLGQLPKSQYEEYIEALRQNHVQGGQTYAQALANQKDNFSRNGDADFLRALLSASSNGTSS